MGDFMKTPPMGWNSWDCYGASVREDEVLANARFMADNLLKYGWEYITVDIQWSEPGACGTEYRNLPKLCMDEYGRQMPAENRFPSAKGGAGFKPLADAVHAMGLKFGIHILRGIPRQAVYADCPVMGTGYTARDIAQGHNICPWNMDMYGVDAAHPGAQAYYDSLLALYAEWGVDLIKVDDMAHPEYRNGEDYHSGEARLIRNAIDKCGRSIVFSFAGHVLAQSSERRGRTHQYVAHIQRLLGQVGGAGRAVRPAYSVAAVSEARPLSRRRHDTAGSPVGALQ